MSACGPWLELLVAHYADQFRDEFDVLVAFIHWCYVSRGCVGLGSPPSNFELTPARVASLLRDAGGGTELLPAGWNSSGDTWTLAYKIPDPKSSSSTTATPSVIVLKAVRIGDELSVNVVRPTGDPLSESLTPTAVINGDDLRAKPGLLFKDATGLKVRVAVLFVDPILPRSTASADDDAESRRRRDEDVRSRASDEYLGPSHSGLRDPRSVDPLRDIGRSDLDPFSGGVGGGMVFDPFRAGRGGGNTPFGPDGRPLPHGAVPPGARFDPFTPFGQGGAPGRGRGRGRGFGPDPDHDPPPGWDDMFM